MLKNKLVLGAMFFLMILTGFSSTIPYGLNDLFTSENIEHSIQSTLRPFNFNGKPVNLDNISYSHTLSSCFTQTQSSFINPLVASSSEVLGLRVSYQNTCDLSSNEMNWLVEDGETLDVLISTSPMAGTPVFPLYNSTVVQSFTGLTTYQLLLHLQSEAITLNGITYPAEKQYVIVFKVNKLYVFYTTPRFSRSLTEADLEEFKVTLDLMFMALTKITQ
jgi:hypothetical protein